MSYILDALKQSDNQRKDTETAGVIPHVEVTKEDVNPSNLKGWAWLGLLLMSVFFVWFLTAKESGIAVEQTEVATLSQDSVADVADSSAVLPETDSISKEDLYGVTIDVSDPSEAAEARQAQSGKVARQQAEAVNSGKGQSNKLAAVDRSKLAISSVSPGVPASKATSTGDNTQALIEPAQRKQQAAADSGKEEIIYWRQLPLDVQRSLPELQFSVHIYTTEPAARMVKVNGRMLHEGDLVSYNVRLLEITKRGVVLIFKGHRFRMNAV